MTEINPLFSIIIPSYNAERYLEECIRSVEGQTLHDFEVVAVDDGSTDSTAQILRSWESRRAYVGLLSQSNRGLLAARRAGLSRAKGEYVVFLDSDDCLVPNALERLAEVLAVARPDILSFEFYREESNPRKEGGAHGLLPGTLYEGGFLIKAREAICSGNYNNLCGKVIRREVLLADETDYEGTFSRLQHGEDWLQLLGAADHASSVLHLSEPLYFYRPNDSSMTARYRSSQLDDLSRLSRMLMSRAHVWGGPCESAARAALVLHVGYLARLVVLTCHDERGRDAELRRMSDVLQVALEGKPWDGSRLRFDMRVIGRALVERNYGRVVIVTRATSLLKRLLGKKA